LDDWQEFTCERTEAKDGNGQKEKDAQERRTGMD
jgi:hypothetical protein